MTTKSSNEGASISILLVTETESRAAALRQLVQLVLPRASVIPVDFAAAEQPIPRADVALVDTGASQRAALDALRFIRARGFQGAIVVTGTGAADATMRNTAQSLGATCITESRAEALSIELGAAIAAALAENSAVSAEVAQARRIFAAGQAALSLQHSINNPLAALLAEAQLLELEELTPEQREALERMVELCRRIVVLVRRLDALAAG